MGEKWHDLSEAARLKRLSSSSSRVNRGSAGVHPPALTPGYTCQPYCLLSGTSSKVDLWPPESRVDQTTLHY